jgi:alpha-beta hydrolase superfamily lysophospholipase
VTTPAPLTDQQLDEYEAAIAAYQQHPDLGFACCSAHPAADAAAAMASELRRLRAELATARATVLAAEADLIVRHCPDHGTADSRWVNCHCVIADDMRNALVGLLPAAATPAPRAARPVS